MPKASKKVARSKPKGLDWSKAIRNPHAAVLRTLPWRVKLDPDLVDLLSGMGSPAAHLSAFASKVQMGSKRERLVMVLRLSNEEIKPLRPILKRIGAEVEQVPPHPSWKRSAESSTGRRKKAG